MPRTRRCNTLNIQLVYIHAYAPTYIHTYMYFMKLQALVRSVPLNRGVDICVLVDIAYIHIYICVCVPVHIHV